MRKRFSILWMCALLLAACSPFAEPTPVSTLIPTLAPVPTLTSTPKPPYPDLAISIVANCGLEALCTVKIDADGNVEAYAFGGGFVTKTPRGMPLEKRTARMTPEQIQELVAAINKANVWMIESDRGRCCDMAPFSVSVTLNGRTKQVSRYDAWGPCVKPPDATPEPGAALCELRKSVEQITNSLDWVTVMVPPTPTPRISSAKVVVTVFEDMNRDGTPEPAEGLSGIPVQLRLPNRMVLSALTQQDGTLTFDMSGFAAGTQITASLPNLYRSYQFFLPESGTVPVMFSFAQPTLPGK